MSLFRPIRIRGLEIRNRVWVPPLCQYSVTELDGVPHDWHLVHLGSMAAGGAGLLPIAKEAVDAGQLAARFAKEAEKERQYVARTGAKLANEAFVSSAPADIVEKERQKLKDAEVRAAKLEKYLADLA